MKRFLLRSMLPLIVFLVVLSIHFVLEEYFLEQNFSQSQWVLVPGQASTNGLRHYIQSGDYWFGYSYALSLTFAVIALRRYRECRLCQARNLVLGSMTCSGFLAVAGCYLIGCCGSPMLIVYLNLFGTAFLPLTKLIMAIITTLTIGLAWWYLLREEHKMSESSLGNGQCK